jgi:hypothetical protein
MRTMTRIRSRGRAVACASFVAAALFCATTASAGPPADVPVQPAPALLPAPPELDPGFYDPPPAVVAATPPGGIIAAREVRVANAGLVPVNVDAWQLSYRSNDARDQPLAAVTTVLKPRGSTPGKLLSSQLAEDSLAGYCAPSYALQHLSVSAFVGQITVPAEFVIAQGALEQGWAVSLPDHQGPNNAYAAGPEAGRITLDGIRAARNFAPLQLTDDARIGLYGYSGGAIATGHAAELHAGYAPELNIVGAAEGGVPADLGVVLDVANGQATSGLILGAINGLAHEYPDFDRFLRDRVDPFGQAIRTVQSPLCVQYLTALLPFLNIKGMLHSQGDPTVTEPEVVKVLDETRMGKTVPDMPMYIWNANPDEIIPVGQVNTLVDTYCADPRAQVRYTREHLGEHIATEISGTGPALNWLRDRLDGAPAPTGCHTSDDGWLALDPDGTRTTTDSLGQTFLGLFGYPLGAGVH